MRLKKDVELTSGEAMALRLGGKARRVDEADEYIFRALAQGLDGEAELTRLVARREQMEEVTAELRLAQLVLDYGEYFDADMDVVIEL